MPATRTKSKVHTKTSTHESFDGLFGIAYIADEPRYRKWKKQEREFMGGLG